MKTIIISKDSINGKTLVIEELYKGACRSGYGISKDTKIFESKKIAMERFKKHPCYKHREYKFICLNKKQLSYVNLIMTATTRFYIDADNFMRI